MLAILQWKTLAIYFTHPETFAEVLIKTIFFFQQTYQWSIIPDNQTVPN